MISTTEPANWQSQVVVYADKYKHGPMLWDVPDMLGASTVIQIERSGGSVIALLMGLGNWCDLRD